MNNNMLRSSTEMAKKIKYVYHIKNIFFKKIELKESSYDELLADRMFPQHWYPSIETNEEAKAAKWYIVTVTASLHGTEPFEVRQTLYAETDGKPIAYNANALFSPAYDEEAAREAAYAVFKNVRLMIENNANVL
jgi:hypothetical protein